MSSLYTGIAFPTLKAFTQLPIPPAKTCQWIEELPSDNDECKCGGPIFENKSYCEEHYNRSIDKAEMQRRQKRREQKESTPFSFQSTTPRLPQTEN